MKTIQYHDDFIADVSNMIEQITKLKKEKKYKEAAQISYNLALTKVNYYEQFVNNNAPTSNYKKIHEEEYENALNELADAIDVAYDYGILKDC